MKIRSRAGPQMIQEPRIPIKAKKKKKGTGWKDGTSDDSGKMRAPVMSDIPPAVAV